MHLYYLILVPASSCSSTLFNFLAFSIHQGLPPPSPNSYLPRLVLLPPHPTSRSPSSYVATSIILVFPSTSLCQLPPRSYSSASVVFQRSLTNMLPSLFQSRDIIFTMAGAAKKRAAKDRKAGHNGRDNTETGVTLTEPSPSQPALQVDGPGDPHGPGSTSGLPVRERQTSNAPPPSQASTSVKPILRDPARDMSIALNRNVDFPGNVYNIFSEVSSSFAMRFLYEHYSPNVFIHSLCCVPHQRC